MTGMALGSATSLDAALRRIFIAYCSYGDIDNTSLLSSAKFSKLARDAGVFGGGLSSADVDLMFVRMTQSPVAGTPAGRKAPAGARKMLKYPQFLDALLALSAKKYGSPCGPAPLSALSRLLKDHILPLLGAQEPSEEADAPPLDPAAAELLDAHAALLENIFEHYCKAAESTTKVKGFDSSFWQALQQSGALPDPASAAAQPLATAATAAADVKAGAVLDQPGWLRLCGHLSICPEFLTKAELGRLFQQRLNGANCTLDRFVALLGAAAAAAFPAAAETFAVQACHQRPACTAPGPRNARRTTLTHTRPSYLRHTATFLTTLTTTSTVPTTSTAPTTLSTPTTSIVPTTSAARPPGAA